MDAGNERPVVQEARQRDDVNEPNEAESPKPACPVCGGQLMDIRRKLTCMRCHSIIETCCD